jgi:formate-dependent phosphoribosylglycinamide formyltransferase (GAR transformylase)
VFCQWRLQDSDFGSQTSLASPFKTVDVFFLPDIAPLNGDLEFELFFEAISSSGIDEKRAETFLLAQLDPHLDIHTSGPVIKFLIPAEKGYVVQSDVLGLRMASCKNLHSIYAFRGAFEEVGGLAVDDTNSLRKLISCASGALVLQPNTATTPIESLDFIDTQMAIRMSIPWILPSPPAKQTIVAIGSHKYLQSMETFYIAAQSLGIQLLLVASKDDPAYSHCRDSIITVDMTLDQGLNSRIVKALKTQPESISGVVAYRDNLLVTAAEVAEELGLPTSPSSAVETCVNKHAMRMRAMSNCSQFIYARDLQHLQEQLNILPKPLEFPLVVKPSAGQGSVGVSKVTDTKQLFNAVQAIENHGTKPGVIVESYIDGPEIDANFVMLDGEVLFFEVVDNFPCTADDEEDQKTDSFLERDMVYPSGLGESEIAVIKKSIQELLVDNLGFQTGVFHVEGRLCGSIMQYTTEDGITDLRLKDQSKSATPSVFILEVNARCPGVAGVHPTAYTYGVDLAALWLLTAVRDTQRLRALSRGFLNGPELWCDLVPITVTRGGTLESDDIMEELGQRRPDLMAQVSSTTIFYRRGDVIPEPSLTNLSGIIVEFVAFSRKSRGDLLEIVKQIREEVRIDWK